MSVLGYYVTGVSNMPMYCWECSKCKKQDTVVRSFAEYDVPPEEEKSDSCEKHDWVRDIGANITVVKGNHFGKKGSW